MAWKITWFNRAVFDGERARPVASTDWYSSGAETKKLHAFRMLDDDGMVYFEGVTTRDHSFCPLDDFGRPDSGCTEIQYKNVDGKWETL